MIKKIGYKFLILIITLGITSRVYGAIQTETGNYVWDLIDLRWYKAVDSGSGDGLSKGVPAYATYQGGINNGTLTWNNVTNYLNNLSCIAVTTTGACNTINMSTSPKTKHTWTVVITGAPTAVNVNLEGSLDNTNWFTLDSSTTTTSEMRHIVNKGVLYIRGNVTTLTGGTAPTVTVRIASFNY